MESNNEMVKEEMEKLDLFVQKSQQLYESKVFNCIQGIIKGKSILAGHVTEKGKLSWKVKDMHITMLKKHVSINRQNEMLYNSATLFEGQPFVKDPLSELDMLKKKLLKS